MEMHNSPPKQKLERRFPRPIVASFCIWAYIAAFYLLPTSIGTLNDPTTKPEQIERYLLTMVSGVFAAGVALYLTIMLLIQRHQQHRWAGQYYEFNSVQLRVTQTIKGEPIFNWQDVLDALEIQDQADRKKLLSAMRAKLYIQGQEREPYISKTGLWHLLRQKNGRPAILFKQFLNQHPLFAQHFPPETPQE